MSPLWNRREFTQVTASGTFGVMSTSLLGPAPADAMELDPAEKRLVVLGLNALARAAEMKYFTDGHRGAALISAHLLCVEEKIPPAGRARIEQLFDANWAKTRLCQPFPESEPAPNQLHLIGEALAEARGSLREVGHNAIFAMMALKGFRLLPSAATPERIAGVCRLIREIQPWRDIDPDPEVDPPPFTDAAAAAEFVLREASAAVDRFIGFGQGFAGHMLTFGQALVELAEMGDVEWAESCRVAFRKYVTVTRQGPKPDDRKIREHQPSPLRPNQTAYWRQRGEKTLGIGHVFKYPYSYYDLMRRTNNAELKREWDAKAFRIF